MGYSIKKIKPSIKVLLSIWLLVLISILGIKAYLYYEETRETTLAVSEHPKIRVYNNFIAKNEANHLIKLARNRLTPSKTLVDGQFFQHPGRSSSTAALYDPYDKVIRKMQEKACKLVNRNNLIFPKSNFLSPTY